MPNETNWLRSPLQVVSDLLSIPVCVPLEQKTLFDYIVALAPVCTAAIAVFVGVYVAFINKRQADAADRKQSLDLYDRRFQIYMCAVDFFQALMMWSANGNKDNVHDKFIRAKLESTFLFKRSSGVREILDEIDRKAMIVIGFWDSGQGMANSDPAYFADWDRRKDQIITWFDGELQRLEKAMIYSRSFHESTLKRANSAFDDVEG